MFKEGALVVEGEAAVVPLHGHDHPVVLEQLR